MAELNPEYPWKIQEAEAYVSDAQDLLQDAVENIFDEELVEAAAQNAIEYLSDAVTALKKVANDG